MPKEAGQVTRDNNAKHFASLHKFLAMPYSRMDRQQSQSLLRPQSHKMVFWRMSEPIPPMTKKRRMKLLWSYSPDWYVPSTVLLSRVDSVRFLGLSLLYLRACSISKAQLCSQCRNSAIFFALDSVPGFKREFSLADTSYAHNVMSPCYAPADQRAHPRRLRHP
jgi:hypothetical protein